MITLRIVPFILLSLLSGCDAVSTDGESLARDLEPDSFMAEMHTRMGDVISMKGEAQLVFDPKFGEYRLSMREVRSAETENQDHYAISVRSNNAVLWQGGRHEIGYETPAIAKASLSRFSGGEFVDVIPSKGGELVVWDDEGKQYGELTIDAQLKHGQIRAYFHVDKP